MYKTYYTKNGTIKNVQHHKTLFSALNSWVCNIRYGNSRLYKGETILEWIPEGGFPIGRLAEGHYTNNPNDLVESIVLQSI